MNEVKLETEIKIWKRRAEMAEYAAAIAKAQVEILKETIGMLYERKCQTGTGRLSELARNTAGLGTVDRLRETGDQISPQGVCAKDSNEDNEQRVRGMADQADGMRAEKS
jgi:hypothetical protein